MRKNIALLLVIFVCHLSLGCRTASSVPRPLNKSELLALVAGESHPANVVAEINSNGLTFTPDAAYVALLKTAGADASILAALNTAKHSPSGNAAPVDSATLLSHLSNAGRLIRARQLDDAAAELSAALANDAAKSATGFVMGDLLMCQSRWEEAGQVYSEIARQDPAFPDIHTKLSAAYFNSQEPENALREAKAAIARNPGNGPAHVNAGLSLETLRNFDGAKAEMQRAISSEPDYANGYAGLGGVLYDLHDYDAAIAQYKKALALKPDDVNTRYNLGVVYADKGDFTEAIREYRDVKHRDSARLDARQNLGAALMHQDPAAAITEFRELATMAPDFQICHQCLGNALLQTGRIHDAEEEFRTAIRLDPADPRAQSDLGRVYEVEKNYDAALDEYRKAEQLDETLAATHADAGRILLLKKDFTSSIAELKRAEDLDPTSWMYHDLRGQALQGSGDRDGAIAEYQEAISLAPKELQARIDLALALEQKGDWIAALENYRRAALDEPPVRTGIPQQRFDAQNQLRAAQERFRQHLAELRSSGKSSEAASLEARLKTAESSPNLDEHFHAAMQASVQAATERRFDAAETSAKEAIAIAEKIQPPDGRLPEAEAQLGNVYAWRLDYPQAEQAYKRQLTLTEKLYGPQAPMLTAALQNLAMTKLAEKDFPSAETFVSRALQINQTAYGENSTGTADTLRLLAQVYSMQKNFAKSEPTLLRAMSIYETIYGSTDYRLAIPLTSLCFVYDQWGKPKESESCHAHLVSLEEKQFGAESPYLVRDLTAEAQALRQLGRADDAAKIDQRTQSIQGSQAKPR
jgi:tetratricopeptide (TPR) repeat protein